ncbi:MAG: DUF2029 domain-containing protein [Alphaproteobacteria bacterium]|nr:DUF2029 domain-containing protein [Alphaproteobacteria bacterium]
MSRIQQALRGRVSDRAVDAVPLLVQLVADGVPLGLGLWIAAQVLVAFAGRLTYPYDLEWMEGGMLTHAWRIREWYSLYTEPGPDWIPYIYPPGYSAVVAALSLVTGLDMAVGRAVSVLGTLAACVALVFGCWRHAGNALVGVLGATLFLSLYPDSGAFYDLVRPDGLAMGLLAWSLVLGIDADRRARIASGLLLAAAFTVKHNAAAYGLPMALGIAVRFGAWEALWFGLASAGPALLFTVALQIASGGHFLTTILGVPAAHPMVMGRFAPGTVEELGKAVGIGSLAGSVGLAALTMARSRDWAERGVIAACAAAFAALMVRYGMGLVGTPGIREPEPWMEQVAWASIGVALGAVLGAALVRPVGRARLAGPAAAALGVVASFVDPPAWVAEIGLSTSVWAVLAGAMAGSAAGLVAAAVQKTVDGRWVYGVGVCAMALLTAGLMRGHHGGFLNVYIPMFWVLSLSVGMALGLSRRAWPRLEVYALGAVLVGAQLWAKTDFEAERYLPIPEDVAAGDAFVETLRDCEGPVLSPFNPWLPVLAGHDPSFHLIALWDIDHRRGPYVADMEAIRQAGESGYWGCVVSGSGRPLGFGIQKAYEVWRTPPVENVRREGGGPPTFAPRTGWRARPQSILVPRR